MEDGKMQAKPSVVVVGVDESSHSEYALEWTLRHFFSGKPCSSMFKLVIVHAKPITTSVVNFAGAGSADVLPFVDLNLKKVAERVVHKAKELCLTKLVSDVSIEVVEGDARHVLCDAVNKHHADILVVGSHGYGAVKRVVLGSVSDYCVHHARCTVMIVKKPKNKH